MTGIELRNRRGIAGLTLRQLGDRAKLSAPFLSDVEHGRRKLSPEAEDRVRAALGVEPRLPDEPSCVVCRTVLVANIIETSTIHDPNGVIGPGYRPLRQGGKREAGLCCRRCGLHYAFAPTHEDRP